MDEERTFAVQLVRGYNRRKRGTSPNKQHNIRDSRNGGAAD